MVLHLFGFEKAVEASSLEVFIKQTNLLREYFGHCFGKGGGINASEGRFPGNNEDFFLVFDYVNLGNLITQQITQEIVAIHYCNIPVVNRQLIYVHNPMMMIPFCSLF